MLCLSFAKQKGTSIFKYFYSDNKAPNNNLRCSFIYSQTGNESISSSLINLYTFFGFTASHL